MTTLAGGVAVITGAGSGIGRALALHLADQGCNLALSDINHASVEVVAAEAETKGVRTSAHALDVADRAAVYAYADTVAQHHGGATIVVNNAGVALSQTMEHLNYDDWEWVMGINWWGVVYGTHAFLPQLKAADAGHIVNLSSLFGLIGVPTQAAYCATKFAVRGFSESIRAELSPTNVNVTTIHPGGIKTNIAKSSRFTDGISGGDKQSAVKQFDRLAITTPESAAKQIANGIARNKARVVIGRDAKTLAWLERLSPNGYHKLMQRHIDKTKV